jgi:hypothetical protein
MIRCELKFEELCKIDNAFSESHNLKLLFESKEVRTIVIMMCIEKNSRDQTRKIFGFYSTPDEENLKQIIGKEADNFGVTITWHTKEEYKKILPINKDQRDFIQSIKTL